MSVAQAEALRPGFAEPVFDAQAVFRCVLTALSRPGTVVELTTDVLGPEPVGPAATALGLTLFDAETPVWLDAALAEHATVGDYFAFHCGCPLVGRPQEAAFALVRSADTMPPLAAFRQGRDQYPEESATLTVEVVALEGGPPVTLRGPGIDGTATLAAKGLGDRFWQEWAVNAASFPLGVDVVLTCRRRLVGLPRSIVAEG